MTGVVTILAILVLWSWLSKSSIPPTLREARASYWQEPKLPRLQSIANKLEKLRTEIEEQVGLIDSPELASLHQGDLAWEDCVDDCFGKEKKLWLQVSKEYNRITQQISELERHQQRTGNLPNPKLRM